MRYWIYWNEMVQGPFELDELVGLHAFSDDLPVCLENRQEWMPASRVADLSPTLELTRARRSAPPPLPPPPPPDRPPAMTPLQGEFFGEPPGQQHFFESNGSSKGPFAYAPALASDSSVGIGLDPTVTVTMPIRFSVVHPESQIRFDPKPAVNESPVMLPIHIAPPVLVERAREVVVPAPSPLANISLDLPPLERPALSKKLSWLPWGAGALVVVGVLVRLVYWMIDHYSSKAAIVETRPPVVSAPVRVVPPPKAKPVPSVKIMKPKPAPRKAMPEEIEQFFMPVTVAKTETTTDAWANRQNDAIQGVMAHKIRVIKTTVGELAKAMIEEMHQKELLHAADTGERLYLPDKIVWSALREEGVLYRVYLNFSGLQATGERVQVRSYTFRTDLKAKSVISDDAAARQDFLEATTAYRRKHELMADDIDSVLSAVDLYNKQKMHAIIIKDGRKNKDQRKNIQLALDAAKGKVRRSVLYFRTKYPEKALQNVAKAYNFTELLKL